MPTAHEHGEDEGVVVTRSAGDDVGKALVRGKHELELDEAEWIPGGDDTAPWPSNYLLVATAGCQVEAMQQALEKARIPEYDIRISATTEVESLVDEIPEYPDHMSWRYTKIDFDIDVETTPEYEDRVRRIVDLAEDACIVSRSVERGIDFETTKDVTVTPSVAGD